LLFGQTLLISPAEGPLFSFSRNGPRRETFLDGILLIPEIFFGPCSLLEKVKCTSSFSAMSPRQVAHNGERAIDRWQFLTRSTFVPSSRSLLSRELDVRCRRPTPSFLALW